MGTTLDKTITRNSGNTVAIDTNYSELNTKADAIVEDVVSHVEAQLATTETALQTAEGLVDTKIASLLSVGDTGYTKDVVDVNLSNQINALAPYSGYTQVSKKMDNFAFKEDANFTYSVADKNRFVKFGDKVVDTYGEELALTFNSMASSTVTVADNTVIAKASNYSNDLFSTANGGSTKKGNVYKIAFDILSKDFNTLYYRFNNVHIAEQNVSTLGHHEVEVVGTVDGGYISFHSPSVENNAEIANISVKEIQTADFTDTAPTVTEIITDGSNSTSGAVAKGEYVLDDSGELVTNGTFDSDVSGWTNDEITSSITSGVATIVVANTGATYPALRQNIPVINGVKYIISGFIDTTALAEKTGAFLVGNTIIKSIPIGESGNYSAEYTANTSGNVSFGVGIGTSNGASGLTISIDNISVRRVSDVFQSIEDAPTSTALTNTAYFQDKTKIGVTHQSLAYHAYNTLTSSYEGIKTEVLLTDTYAGDTTKEVMLKNGFSEVSEFLYSKGGYLCLPVGLAQMLNSGAYHPVLNSRGTAKLLIDGYGYSTWSHSQADGFYADTADAFTFTGTPRRVYIGSHTANQSGHPQSKFYDIIYSDQFKDLREYAKIANKYEIELLREDKVENGVEESVSTVGTSIFNGAVSQTLIEFSFTGMAVAVGEVYTVV